MALVLGFAAILGVAGIGSARASNDAGAHPPVGTDTVPQTVREGGPWVDAIRNPVTSRNLPPKTIALTFDDGPDPTWTPQVVAVLSKHHVPARSSSSAPTSAATRHLVTAIRDSGSELGVHTFSHPDLVDVSPWRMQRELDETQLAIAGSAGDHDLPAAAPLLLDGRRRRRPRLPHRAGGGRARLRHGFHHAGQRGLAAARRRRDHRPTRRPKPDDPNGAVVLMHDAGGDRSETVTALDQYIPQMQAKGYRFTTVTAGFGMPGSRHARVVGEPRHRARCCSAWWRSPPGSWRGCAGSCSSSACSWPCGWC